MNSKAEPAIIVPPRVERSRVEVGDLVVEVVRKDIRNLHLSVYPPLGDVRVAAPLHLPDEAVRLAVLRRLIWIRQQRQRFQTQARQTEREHSGGESHYAWGRRYLLRVVERAGAHRVTLRGKVMELGVSPGTTPEARGQLLARWYRQQLRAALAELVPRWEQRLGVQIQAVGIKRMKTLWGSCKPEARRVWFNLELAKKPRPCLEYVVVHELAHLIDRSHGERFTELMNEHLPRWPALRAELNAAPLAAEEWSGAGQARGLD